MHCIIFLLVTGLKCSYGKISSPLTAIPVGKTEISVTEPVRPLIRTHQSFYKGFRGKARSRKAGQPGQPGSYEEALSLPHVFRLHRDFVWCCRGRKEGQKSALSNSLDKQFEQLLRWFIRQRLSVQSCID